MIFENGQGMNCSDLEKVLNQKDYYQFSIVGSRKEDGDNQELYLGQYIIDIILFFFRC